MSTATQQRRDRKVVADVDLQLDDELKLLTVSDVARILRCSRRSVYVAMDCGLPYSNWPDRRVSIADLRAFVRSTSISCLRMTSARRRGKTTFGRTALAASLQIPFARSVTCIGRR